MSNVVSIRRGITQPPECAHALALLRQAQAILDRLVDSGRAAPGSPPDETRNYLQDAIGMLRP
jgi:hypothetical protein